MAAADVTPDKICNTEALGPLPLKPNKKKVPPNQLEDEDVLGNSLFSRGVISYFQKGVTNLFQV